GYHAKYLQYVILYHVSESTGAFVIAATIFDSSLFRHRDLHRINVIPVPERFEQGVCKTKSQDILHSLFAEIVVYAVNLFFLEVLRKHLIKLYSSLFIMPKRLFDDNMIQGGFRSQPLAM